MGNKQSSNKFFRLIKAKDKLYSKCVNKQLQDIGIERKCCICYSTENVEPHKIVPSHHGGNDQMINFLFVCDRHRVNCNLFEYMYNMGIDVPHEWKVLLDRFNEVKLYMNSTKTKEQRLYIENINNNLKHRCQLLQFNTKNTIDIDLFDTYM